MSDPRAYAKANYGGDKAPKCRQCQLLKPFCRALGERAHHTRCSFFMPVRANSHTTKQEER